ncbi:hypothetical protein G7Z17_g11673 [Cylindrodendrum hubeiense]|uniref:Uncharacterized protein n=1 Tax=Cylindrodendrum hubeiense TaxID=595255 RepID=A0A9P5H4M2_9HYPO|nr:hypothetical protein G7Z17_g11673 [Cylindrodendrum hubeiense]
MGHDTGRLDPTGGRDLPGYLVAYPAPVSQLVITRVPWRSSAMRHEAEVPVADSPARIPKRLKQPQTSLAQPFIQWGTAVGGLLRQGEATARLDVSMPPHPAFSLAASVGGPTITISIT